MISDYGQVLRVVWLVSGPKTGPLGIQSESKLGLPFGRFVRFSISHYVISDYGQVLWVVWLVSGPK